MKKTIALILSLCLLLGSLSLGSFAGSRADLGNAAVLSAALALPEKADADKWGITACEKPEYCLFCSEIHTGVSGFFVQVFHQIAYSFCKLFHIEMTRGRMKFNEITIDVGIETPFQFLHMSDTHLSLCDKRDDEKKQKLADQRLAGFPHALRMLDDAGEKASELGTFIVHTGDLIDFVSEKNLDTARAFTSENDVFACAGNHEYSLYVWDDLDETTRRESLKDKVQSAFTNDIRFFARLEHGVEFIAIDNGYHKIEQWQLDRLKEEIAKGYPIILCLHAPLYAPDIYDYTAEVFGKPMWMMSVPDELTDKNDEGEYLAQKEDAVTHEAYELITHCDSIKAILAGHMHYDYVSQVTPTLKQYVVNTETGNIVTVR